MRTATGTSKLVTRTPPRFDAPGNTFKMCGDAVVIEECARAAGRK